MEMVCLWYGMCMVCMWYLYGMYMLWIGYNKMTEPGGSPKKSTNLNFGGFQKPSKIFKHEALGGQGGANGASFDPF